VSVQDDWGSGYCNNVKVTNPGTAPLTWSVTLEIQGNFNHAWNANATHSGSQTTFSGQEYFNDELAPGESTSFGYCANR
jgi:cellulase/cellobiase CelA1